MVLGRRDEKSSYHIVSFRVVSCRFVSFRYRIRIMNGVGLRMNIYGWFVD